MAEISLIFRPEGGVADPDLATPQLAMYNGTAHLVYCLRFDASTDEYIFFPFVGVKFPGNVAISVDVYWFADSATSGAVVWGVQFLAVTPGDNVSVEAKTFATESTATQSHLGTTAHRLHKATISVSASNTDALYLDDWAVMRLRRLASNGSDTMTGDAAVVFVVVRYNDS